MPGYGFSQTYIFPHGEISLRENPYYCIFYAVLTIEVPNRFHWKTHDHDNARKIPRSLSFHVIYNSL